MAGSHDDYKTRKAAQDKARRERLARDVSASKTTSAERAHVQLTPGELFTCVWFRVYSNGLGVGKKLRLKIVGAYLAAVLLGFIFPSIFGYAFLVAAVSHALVLAFSFRQSVDAMKDIVAASELPNPEYDRKGRRLRDRTHVPLPTRTADEVADAWDKHRRYGNGRPYDG